jgi:hypothetical protein
MMAMLKETPPEREPWDESEVPAKPSALEWPEPPPVVAHTPTPTEVRNPAAPVPQSEAAIPIEDEDLQAKSIPSVKAVPAPNPPPVPKRPPAPAMKKN